MKRSSFANNNPFSGTRFQERVETLILKEDHVLVLDQTALPREVRYTKILTIDEMRHAIKTMIVRGAPAIGVAGAFGLLLGARRHAAEFLHRNPLPHWGRGQGEGENKREIFIKALMIDADLLESARPTAVNLKWAMDRFRRLISTLSQEESIESLLKRIEDEAKAIFQEDIEMCRAIGQHGKKVVPKGGRVLTYCNAGALATAGYGTALGVVRAAFEEDPSIELYVSETRPRLQGARLTTWEMIQEGIPVTLITDNMAAWLMKQGHVDVIIVGADRIAANGDTANKIGTYMLALAAKAHNIPFYVAAPSSTIDISMASGEEIPIEERPEEEIYWIHNESICPEGVKFYNPAFDVTPAGLIAGIITEKGMGPLNNVHDER